MVGLGKLFKWFEPGAALRVGATAIVILCSRVPVVHAGFDLSAGATFRSYPLSGAINAESGYGVLLWGTNSSGSPWYGYLRPHIEGSSALTYNSLGGAVEFYPLSFLGGRVGGEAAQNDRDYSAYDCVHYKCRGRFYRTYASVEMTLAAGPVFGQFRWQRERWTLSSPAPVAFVEPTNALALAGQGDSETVYRGMLGLNLNPSWSLLGVLVYAQAGSDHAISRFPFMLARYRRGYWTLAAGGGSYASAIKRQEMAALMFLNWEIKPSMGLH